MADVVPSETGTAPPSPLTSPRLWAIVALVFCLLFLAYWFLIRTAYEPLVTDVAPQDAADMVKVLDARKLPYRLADGGRTILVASDDADRARIELVGSELPMRGQVGFELFNQSDMGLTEFAQKINYQRALQGELARTILSLDGIQSVRVHLGLPERSVFRDEQAQAKASVTLILKPGTALTERTVTGIQRMVAGAIPEMGVDDVSVLDGSGRVISLESADADASPAGSDAVLDNYRRQIAAAVARDHPELRYDLNLSLRHLAPTSAADGPATEAPAGKERALSQAAPRGNPDFAINVRITTAAPLDDGLRLELMRDIQEAIDFDGRRGDGILFLVGEVLPAPTSTAVAADRVVANAAKPVPADKNNAWSTYWPAGIFFFAILSLAAWISDRRRKARPHRTELVSFAEQLRERLHATEGAAT